MNIYICMCVSVAVDVRSRSTYIFISSMEQIYHLIKGKRAGMLAVPELSLLLSGSALVEGNVENLEGNPCYVPMGTLVAGCVCWMRQHGHGAQTGFMLLHCALCSPSPASFRGISTFACAGEVWGFWVGAWQSNSS